ncbi:hypothetical protein Q1695_007302 [Nippostrongylus brasiliensis]|nr:hypothetical protein Q1695_007302 [Nippostrongylus brasiliensis]
MRSIKFLLTLFLLFTLFVPGKQEGIDIHDITTTTPLPHNESEAAPDTDTSSEKWPHVTVMLVSAAILLADAI